MNDVLVVGGGPAGAATAIHLAGMGRRVRLLERATFPRGKPCGEALMPAGVRELAALGVLHEVNGHPISGVRFRAGAQAATARFPGQPALGIMRRELDALLIARARLAGVDVVEGLTVRSLALDQRGRPAGAVTDEGVERATVIVAADGLRSRLRREAGLERGAGRVPRYGATVHVRTAGPTASEVEVHIAADHELYVTPLGNGIVNLAWLGGAGLMRSLSAQRWKQLHGLLQQALGLEEPAELLDAPAVAGPFPAGALHASRGRLVLAGDALSFFDGITGEGVSLALQGARDCAAAVDEALRTGRTAPFRTYERAVRRRARASTMLGRLSLFLARRPGLAEAAVANLGRHQRAFDRLLAVNAGEAPAGSLRPADALALADPRGLLRRRTG